jgi:hypothetical protein
LLIVLFMITAWFCLSSHCVLAKIALPPEADGCPMHSAPAKEKAPVPKTPCCKEVRAVVAKCVGAAVAKVSPVYPRDHAPEIFRPLPCLAFEIEPLDTGPPVCVSFAELVLQESMLSHAPPVS